MNVTVAESTLIKIADFRDPVIINMHLSAGVFTNIFRANILKNNSVACFGLFLS